MKNVSNASPNMQNWNRSPHVTMYITPSPFFREEVKDIQLPPMQRESIPPPLGVLGLQLKSFRIYIIPHKTCFVNKFYAV